LVVQESRLVYGREYCDLIAVATIAY